MSGLSKSLVNSCVILLQPDDAHTRELEKMKIASLLPGATEALCLLGLDEQIVGISHECDFPDEITHLPRLTRSVIPAHSSSAEINHIVAERTKLNLPLYQVNEEALISASPDLIVTQDLCNVCALSPDELDTSIKQLNKTPQIVSLNAHSFDEILSDITRLAEHTRTQDKATEIVTDLQKRMTGIQSATQAASHRPRVALLEWIDPPFCAGHWTPDLIQVAGGEEIIGKAGQKSRQIQWQALIEAEPDKLILACCGRSVEQTVAELGNSSIADKLLHLTCVTKGELYVMDGSAYLNRPGPRLVDAVEILASILHPNIPNLPCHGSAIQKIQMA